MKYLFYILFFLLTNYSVFAQVSESDSLVQQNQLLDSLYIAEVEEVKGKDKVLHAEPLYIDLIRDLGARKGEKEWNVGVGMTDQKNYDKYTALVEYEFAPIDRLGFEIELPFSFYTTTDNNGMTYTAPSNKLNSIKLATQYSFFVREKISTSMAVGYIHEFELTSFDKYNKERVWKGNIYNPFFVIAKRWGNDYHTMLYAGTMIEQLFRTNSWQTTWQINSNFHYMITGTRNFIGIEFNKEVTPSNFQMVLRPQMRLGIAHNLLVGIVTGIPINRENQRFSTFLRLIYEPKGKKH